MDPIQNPPPTELPKSNIFRNVLIGLGVILGAFVVIDIIFIFGSLTTNIKTTISTQKSLENQVNLTLKKEYDNPFDKNTQYVNPFSQSQNPFDNLTQ